MEQVKLTHKDIVMKLIGEVTPVGETNTDNKRFENLKELCQLTNELLSEISDVIRYKTCQEYSRKRAGDYANKFFDDIGIEE